MCKGVPMSDEIRVIQIRPTRLQLSKMLKQIADAALEKKLREEDFKSIKFEGK